MVIARLGIQASTALVHGNVKYQSTIPYDPFQPFIAMFIGKRSKFKRSQKLISFLLLDHLDVFKYCGAKI